MTPDELKQQIRRITVVKRGEQLAMCGESSNWLEESHLGNHDDCIIIWTESENTNMAQYKFPPAVGRLVQKQLASGQFATEDEVLLAALQTLETDSEDCLAVREALDSLDAGELGMSLQDAFDEVRKRHSSAGHS